MWERDEIEWYHIETQQKGYKFLSSLHINEKFIGSHCSEDLPGSEIAYLLIASPQM